MTSSEVTWPCAICGIDIEDGAGDLVIDQTAVADAETAWATYRQGRSKVISLDVLAAAPADVPWRAIHDSCTPEADEYAIPIEGVRTPAGLLAWTAHLMGMVWLPRTNWVDLIRDKAGVSV